MPSRFSLSFSEPLCFPNDSNRDEHIAMATKIQKLGKVCCPDCPQSVSVGASLALVQGVALGGDPYGAEFPSRKQNVQSS